MNLSGPQWIDPEDFEAWMAISDSLSSPCEPSLDEPKPSPDKLAEILFKACDAGDASLAEKALALGARPNARRVGGSRETPLDAVFSGSKCPLTALALIKAGGVLGPRGWAEGAAAFDSACSGSEQVLGSHAPLMEECKTKTRQGFIRISRSWDALAAASAILAPQAAPSELLRESLGCGRFALAASAAKAGVAFDGDSWRSAAAFLKGNLSMSSGGPVRLAWHGELRLLIQENPAAARQISPDCARSIYDLAVFCGYANLAKTLLCSQLRPNPEWLVSPNISSYANLPSGPDMDQRLSAISPTPLFWAAAALEDDALFELVKQCPAIVRAARAHKASPWVMAECPLSRVAHAAELGIPIDGEDGQGRSLTHVWAILDAAPRAGWATLAKLPGTPFFATDSLGQTGFEAMIAKLSPTGALAAFQKTLARIERKEIRKVAAPSQPPGKSPRRNRL